MRQTALRAFILALGVMGMLAPHPLQAGAPSYCGLGPSGQSCAEFPIVTHYSNTGFDLAGTLADPTLLTPPSYQNYSGMITDTYAPSQQEGLSFITAVERATGVTLHLYNYDSETALSKLQPGLNKIQVIHNVLLAETDSLFTFIFPPGWQPSQRYPIVLSGDGSFTSNNLAFFADGANSDTQVLSQARFMAKHVGKSTQGGGTGLIAVLSNAGGREGQGWHENALRDVARMLRSMEAYGVDRLKVVHSGPPGAGGRPSCGRRILRIRPITPPSGSSPWRPPPTAASSASRAWGATRGSVGS